jgi:hypothetical protein
MVTVDGVMQRAPVHYTTSGSTITFTSNPPAGANVHVRHLGFRTTSTVTQLAANSTITTPTLAGTITTSSAVFTGNVGFQGKIAAAQVGYTPSFSTASITSDGVNAGASFRARQAANTATRSDWGVTNGFRTYINSYDDPGAAYKPLDISANVVNFYTGTSGSVLGVIIDDSGVLKFNSGYGSAANAYACRAWVNFNGTGTVAIRGSGNVSSITDLGVGNYRVNFSTSMPDANYNAVSQATNGTGIGVDDQRRFISAPSGSYATGSFQIGTVTPADNAFAAATVVNVSIFR